MRHLPKALQIPDATTVTLSSAFLKCNHLVISQEYCSSPVGTFLGSTPISLAFSQGLKSG